MNAYAQHECMQSICLQHPLPKTCTIQAWKHAGVSTYRQDTCQQTAEPSGVRTTGSGVDQGPSQRHPAWILYRATLDEMSDVTQQQHS